MAKFDIYDRAGAALRWVYQRRIHSSPILDEGRNFPGGRRFADNWEAIRDEALAVSRRPRAVPLFHELMPEQEAISAKDGREWRLFVLKAYGVEMAENLVRCPATAALLRASPEVLSASFSFLAPGKHIPEHRGPFRGVLRYHLGLSMPRGMDGREGAVLWIDGAEHRLADGDSLLWDDTLPSRGAQHGGPGTYRAGARRVAKRDARRHEAAFRLHRPHGTGGDTPARNRAATVAAGRSGRA